MKVLVAYSSGLGSTKEVSEKIAEILSTDNTITLTLASIDEVATVEPYDAIVVGSSVRANLPLANVRDFFARNKKSFGNKKIALFAVALTANSDQGRTQVINEFLSAITEKYAGLNFVSVEAFGGKVDLDRLNPAMHGLIKKVYENTGINESGSVDTRDWNYIESWGKNLLTQLLA